jgi:hypothetical protein
MGGRGGAGSAFRGNGFLRIHHCHSEEIFMHSVHNSHTNDTFLSFLVRRGGREISSSPINEISPRYARRNDRLSLGALLKASLHSKGNDSSRHSRAHFGKLNDRGNASAYPLRQRSIIEILKLVEMTPLS